METHTACGSAPVRHISAPGTLERWFRSLKTEKLYVEEFETERELKACIEDYISQYNTVRPHMALGYETPAVVFAASFSASA